MAILREGSTVGGKPIATKEEVNTKQNILPLENRRKITSGTANPTDGVNGDIYLQYE